MKIMFEHRPDLPFGPWVATAEPDDGPTSYDMAFAGPTQLAAAVKLAQGLATQLEFERRLHEHSLKDVRAAEAPTRRSE